MTRKAVPQKTKSLLQKEINSICPFCEAKDVDHFQIHHIDENPENNAFENLLMLCPTCHSKITKNDILRSEVEKTKQKLMLDLESTTKNPVDSKIINFNSRVKNAVVGDNNSVTINNVKKKTVNKYPEGCIGHEVGKANYIGYLITRYHEYKEWEVGKKYELCNFSIFHKEKIQNGKNQKSLSHSNRKI